MFFPSSKKCRKGFGYCLLIGICNYSSHAFSLEMNFNTSFVSFLAHSMNSTNYKYECFDIYDP